MRLSIILLIAGLASPVFAQHADHGVSIKALPPGAKETGDHMSQHSLLSTTSGPSPDGAAWLVPSVSGLHVIHNGAQIGNKAPQRVMLTAGQPILITAHKGPLIWTPPGGKPGVVPNDNLIPVKSQYP